MNKTYKCQCQDYHYLEFFKDEDSYCFSFVEEPKTLWEWIKRIFEKRNYVSEIFLDKNQTKELVEEIKKP